MTLDADVLGEVVLFLDEVAVFLVELTLRACNLGFVLGLQFIQMGYTELSMAAGRILESRKLVCESEV